MESFNLKTASAYLNNLLLARGLLRNGKSIEFARPSRGEGGAEATMAQIINLVHDMILRRDREQEQREALAETLRSLRTDTARHNQTIDRLETRNEELARQLSVADSQERAAKMALRTAESSTRALKEEMARLKGTVQQIRTSCANDIRKRDVQIQRLKTHLTAQQRGNKTGLVGASIVITPGVTASAGSASSSTGSNSPSVEDHSYSLRQETTEFLTQLSQSLSDENDNLIGLVRSSLATLRDLQGLPEHAEQGTAHVSEVITQDDHVLHALPSSYESLARDMHGVLHDLRVLLTNPSFVSIEEVAARDEEILRLKEGWEKMESRWREAVSLMDGWRQRLVNGGDTVNLDELKQGLGLGRGFGASTALRDDDLMDADETEELSSDEPVDLEDIEEASTEEEDELDHLPTSLPAPREAKHHDPVKRALRETSGNAPSPRKQSAHPPADGPAKSLPEAVENAPAASSPSGREQSRPAPALSPTKDRSSDSRIPRKTRKRGSSPLPRPRSREARPRLSTGEKLAAARASAEAVAAKARGGAGETGTGTNTNTELDELDVQLRELERERGGCLLGAEGRARGAGARRRAGAAREGGIVPGGERVGRERPGRRRKSTLTPEELEGLMFSV